MKLGSLFDGSGGFPLSGALHGIEPVWAAEIEPYPIAVTKSRFPSMKHYGDVSKMNGAEVEPVDIITFGSPCQDMSIAGKREGLKHEDLGDEETTRSGLFFEAIRIIKEMRKATNGEYPRYAVWENVQGAFSSNKGYDFHAVLEALYSVCDSTVSIPKPYDAKRANQLVWSGAGAVVGNGYSIAWRTLDAQYWGVPQRRKRIYLVADFTGRCAGEILFKQDRLHGNPAESGKAGQSVTADAVGGIDGSVGNCLAARFCQGASPAAQTIGYQEEIAPTVKGAPSGTAQVPAVCYPINDKATRHNGGGDTRRNDGAGNGLGVGKENDPPPTVTAADRHAVCYDARNHNVQDVSGTIQAKPNGGQSLNLINPVCYDARGNGDEETACFQNTGRGWWNESETAATVRTPCGGDSVKANLVAEKKRRYIIRRLTPTECARLQGFQDWWSALSPYDPADAKFWEDVRKTHAEINGKAYKPCKNLKKWYESLHTDSAEYKMWGNGIALPCAEYVIRGIATAMNEQEATPCAL